MSEPLLIWPSDTATRLNTLERLLCFARSPLSAEEVASHFAGTTVAEVTTTLDLLADLGRAEATADGAFGWVPSGPSAI